MVRINTTLVRHGYLSTAPRKPTVALSFKVLEAYQQLCDACPRLSIQGMVHTLCYLHSVPYQRVLVDQLSIAFDIYLDILHSIDKHVATVLHCDTPNWHMCNVCAPCLHALEGEPPLTFAFLATMDGNSSLKLIDDTFHGGTSRHDNRLGRLDLWMLSADVDHFKHKVKQSKKQQVAASGSFTVDPAMDNDDDDTWLDVNIDSAIIMAVKSIDTPCIWKVLEKKTLRAHLSSIATWQSNSFLTSGMSRNMLKKFHLQYYQQALSIIEERTHTVQILEKELKTTQADYEAYLQEECVYLQSLKSEPSEVALVIDYLKALHHLETANLRSGAAKVKYEKLINNPKCFDDKTSKKILSSYCTTLSCVNAIEEEICVLESELNIVEWWLPGVSQYEEMLAELKQQEYHVALNNLEHLVVQ
ncbi:hypothetical protein A0H81_09523 [Grifola frondosa]|uniref:CxC1-like cysteine cluster associated with KDZ transposases domain-containing protein n=1 Tax=Grifola frondosa TaxID=5627 RepID=A0A1C7M1X6_GRIFR|nr:hypothetical protein A0H81_09523 [Grifola frondosa]